MTAPTVTIEVCGLRLWCYHGVMEQERTVGNDFLVDVSLECRVGDSALCDDEISGTVNYADVVDEIKREMAVPSRLLEHVAWRTAMALRHRFPAIEGGTIRVTKLTPPIAARLGSVAVSLRF